ncbi:MAG: hypothetical protein ACI3Y5_08390 [Prevotella sp.]
MRCLLLIAHFLFIGIAVSVGYNSVSEEKVTGFIVAEGYEDLLTDGSDDGDSKAYGADDPTTCHAALTGEQPRMPETSPARRTITTSAQQQRTGQTARHTPYLPAALTPSLPTAGALLSCHTSWHGISLTPHPWARACDYYVFALRRLLI